jgi:hypothetical protein
VATTVKPEEMKLARQVIATFDAPLDLADYRGEYHEGCRQLRTPPEPRWGGNRLAITILVYD